MIERAYWGRKWTNRVMLGLSSLAAGLGIMVLALILGALQQLDRLGLGRPPEKILLPGAVVLRP